jgi:hypothetical protein
MSGFFDTSFYYQAILLLVVLIIVILLTFRQANELRKMTDMQKRPKFVTVEDCNGMITTRDFRQGDFVGLIEGPCDNNGNIRKIVGIYAVKEEKQKKGSRFF